ncbi:MAG: hypothetical protein HFE73_08755 [Firmicutes bacterium]|nr:hypothetical protein [Bacillota bacterium]
MKKIAISILLIIVLLCIGIAFLHDEKQEEPILPFDWTEVDKVEVVSGWSSEPHTYVFSDSEEIKEIVGEFQRSRLLGRRLLKKEGGAKGGGFYTFYLKNKTRTEISVVTEKVDWQRPEEHIFFLARKTDGKEDYPYNQDYLFQGPVGNWYQRFLPSSLMSYH